MSALTSIAGSNPLSALQLNSQDHGGKKDIAVAAREFESLLLSQILKTVSESSGGGWMGTGDDQAGMQALGLAQEQFAASLAAGGGLGLAKMITKAVTAQQATIPAEVGMELK